MRYRSTLLALAAAVACLASSPTVASAAERAPVVDSMPSAAVVAPVTHERSASESIHVYVVAQLVVADAVSRDSAQLHETMRHAVVAVTGALNDVGVPLYRGAILLQDSASDSTVRPTRTDSTARHLLLRTAERSRPGGELQVVHSVERRR